MTTSALMDSQRPQRPEDMAEIKQLKARYAEALNDRSHGGKIAARWLVESKAKPCRSASAISSTWRSQRLRVVAGHGCSQRGLSSSEQGVAERLADQRLVLTGPDREVQGA